MARWGHLGIFGGPWGTLWGQEGGFPREKFSPKIIYPKSIFFRIFGKTFSARVVDQWGHLGIFGGPWGTLGGLEGENFHSKNFPRKQISEKYFSRFFWENFFCSCYGPMGAFRDIWGPLGDARGLEGKNFTRKIFPNIIYIQNVFHSNFSENIMLVLWPYGAFEGIWGPLWDARGSRGEFCYAKTFS